MKITRINSGSSLIEVLIYVAILSIIGAILAGYFVTVISSESEHSKSNDLSTSLQNITATLKYDLSRAVFVSDPPINMGTSSRLEIVTDVGVEEYSISGGSFVKKVGTTTESLTTTAIEVGDLFFKRRDHYENRLNATTTSIEFYILIQNRTYKEMKREINSVFLIGKDSI